MIKLFSDIEFGFFKIVDNRILFYFATTTFLVAWLFVSENGVFIQISWYSIYTSITMRTNLLNWCNLVSISKNVVFYALGVVRIYYFLENFD